MQAEPVVIIDTRDADTYAAGHLPGAVNLREIFTYLATSSAEGLSALKSTFHDHFGAAGLRGSDEMLPKEEVAVALHTDITLLDVSDIDGWTGKFVFSDLGGCLAVGIRAVARWKQAKLATLATSVVAITHWATAFLLTGRSAATSSRSDGRRD